MIDAVIVILLGVAIVALGQKAFSKNGLPLTKTKNLTGFWAKVVGSLCILLGAIIILGFAAIKLYITLKTGDSPNH